MDVELKAAIPQNVPQWIGYTAFGLGFLALRYTSVRRKEGGDEKEGDDGAERT
ncbi:hypothetical protein AWB80_03438 [Caballeronia pedi]|uniref:Uncharacterized protein n=1 Tax=Caballeronia pedi TaxID=1777141 RepID=A0A158BEQ2_9BURK|nr:hypothetical protein [Caballeronia pedi]SAK68539.1 hypothetical protein AWB80_03438 [Caballeronia pedi]